MCFGLTVFSTIVGPFLSPNISIAVSVVLLLFMVFFASGFNLFVLNDLLYLSKIRKKCIKIDKEPHLRSIVSNVMALQ